MSLRPMKPLSRLKPHVGPRTSWNYQPCEARRVRVVVGPCLEPTYWHNGLEGTIRNAVRIEGYPGQEPFYIDDEDDRGWLKVTNGGGPDMGHRSLPVEREIEDEPDEEEEQ